jgi:hypothetical protein
MQLPIDLKGREPDRAGKADTDSRVRAGGQGSIAVDRLGSIHHDRRRPAADGNICQRGMQKAKRGLKPATTQALSQTEKECVLQSGRSLVMKLHSQFHH